MTFWLLATTELQTTGGSQGHINFDQKQVVLV